MNYAAGIDNGNPARLLLERRALSLQAGYTNDVGTSGNGLKEEGAGGIRR